MYIYLVCASTGGGVVDGDEWFLEGEEWVLGC